VALYAAETYTLTKDTVKKPLKFGSFGRTK